MGLFTGKTDQQLAEEYEAEEERSVKSAEDPVASIERWEREAFAVQEWSERVFGPAGNRYTYKVTRKKDHFLVSYNSENGGSWHALMIHQDGFGTFVKAVAEAWRRCKDAL